MINWLKRHFLTLILIIVIIFLGSRSFPGTKTRSSIVSPNIGSYDAVTSLPMSGGGVASNYMYQEAAPVDSTNRMVIQDSSLSLVVKDVPQSIAEIETKVKEYGGYLVDSALNIPDTAASGNIIVRVPEDKRSEAMVAFKNIAVKVVSESVHGTDVTDEFVDLESRLEILNQTKVKYQEILSRAVAVNDLLNVQRELINLQSQIDSLKGQQKYYQQSAKLSRIIVYLSTDELALPYAPTDEWRPMVIFKTAVRSMLTTLRSIGSLIIWVLVYSPLIILAYLGYRLIRRRRQLT